MKRLFPFVLCALLVLLAACDPFEAAQIREQAKADQLAAETVQDNLNQEQARQQAADLHAFQMREEARVQARKDALEPIMRFGLQAVMLSLFIVAIASVLYGSIRIVPVSVLQFNRIQEGFAASMIAEADKRSRLIYMDPNTRQFPVVEYRGQGRFTLTDPNTKVTMELDTRNEGDAQMISGAIAIREAGVLAMEQRKSGAKDAASMALVQPPVIEGTAFDVKTIAHDLVKGSASNE